jgi:restriction system protein
MNVWVVRAEFGKHADAFRSGGYVAIDYSISEPYPIGEGREAFVGAYKKYNPSSKSNVVIGQQVGQITRFCEDMKSGDYVITPSENNDSLYYGRVLGEPYRFEAEPKDTCPYRHRRNVKWSKKTASRSTFSVPFQNTIRSSLTVFSVSQAPEFLTSIEADGYEPPEAAPIYNPYDSVIEQILTLDAQEFEVLVKELLHAIGFEETEVTGKTGDGGVDATGILNVSSLAKVRVYVQAKRYKAGTKINAGVVRQLRMAIPSGGQGAFITTAGYQRKAYDVATEVGFPRIGLINGHQLVDLLVEHWRDIPEEFQSKLGLKIGLVLSG